MKILIYAITFSISIFYVRESYAQQASGDKVALTSIKNFYVDYIKTFLDGPTPESLKHLEFIKNKYITQELINKIGSQMQNIQEGMDPFLKAQECDIDWIRTLKVISYPKHPNSYIVTYLYIQDYEKPHKYSKSTTFISVIRDHDGFKINNVW